MGKINKIQVGSPNLVPSQNMYCMYALDAPARLASYYDDASYTQTTEISMNTRIDRSSIWFG